MVLFQNGYLIVQQTTITPTFDSNGNIIVDSSEQEEQIPCQIDGIPQLQAIREGNTETLTANVYVNYTDIKDPENFHPCSVRLFHNKRGDLGVFVVKALEYYDLTQAFVLTV